MTAVRIPQLQHHKASGLVVVRINGKDRYCGRWGTIAAQSKYHIALSPKRWLWAILTPNMTLC